MSSSEFGHLKIRSYMLVKHQVEHFKNILLVHLVLFIFYFFIFSISLFLSMVNLCLSVSEMHIKRKVAEVSLGKAIIWISNSVVWYVLTITALWQEMPPMAQQTKAAARTLPREPSLPRQSESSCRFSAYICLHNEHKGFALHFF